MHDEEIRLRMWIKFYLTSPLDESVVKERILFFGNFNQAVFTTNKGMLKTINYKLPTSPCYFTAKKNLYHKCQNYSVDSIYQCIARNKCQ